MAQSFNSFAVIVPLLCWAGIFAIFVKRRMATGLAFLITCVCGGTLLTLITELLSLFWAITYPALAGVWSACFLITAGIYFATPKRESVRKVVDIRSGLHKSILVGLVVILLLTGLTALVSPPNNYDSMTYHMSRVIHWMQNQSVNHYPTHITRQLYSSPFAEFTIMHLFVLSGSDRLVNLVQWFSMVSTLLAVAILARQLGGKQPAAFFPVVICATIPIGILQSSSTQNDYLAGFWTLCFVLFAFMPRERVLGSNSLAMAGSLGLAVLTKGSVYPIAFPFLIWAMIRDRKFGASSVLFRLIMVVAVVLALNAGHYTRNYQLFGNPLSTDSEKLANEVVGAGQMAVNAMQNVVMQFASPCIKVNTILESSLLGFCRAIGIDVNDSRTSLVPFRLRPLVQFHEDFAINPLHTLLILATCYLAAIRKSLRANQLFSGYVITAITSFLLFSLLLKWQPFGSRLLLPLFLLWSPAVAIAMEEIMPEQNLRKVAISLLVATFPWLLCNSSRPLLPVPEFLLKRLAPGVAAQKSILHSERISMYYANKPEFRASQQEVAAVIRARGCEQVGLKVSNDYWEYTLWEQLKTSEGQIPRIEHIMVENRSGRIRQKPVKDECIVMSDEGSYTRMLLTDLGSPLKKIET